MKNKLLNRLYIGSIPALIYRLLLCFYILFNLSPGAFDLRLYINISLCVIFILYYTYRAHKNVYQIPFIFDIIFDVSFATLILCNYNRWDWFSGSFIYLMLLCIHNVHYYFTRVILFFICVSLFLYVFFVEFSIRYLSPILLFCCFFWLEHYVSTLYQKRNALNNIIDDFFLSSNNGKSYNIFRESIKLFKERPFKIQINDIFCFRKKDDENRLYLANGTKFLWKYQLLESNQDLDRLLWQTGFKRINIELEGFDGGNHACFIYRDNAISYIYILLLQPNSVLRLTFLKKLILAQFFTRMSRIIEYEYLIKEKRIKGLQEIKQNMNYVNLATTTMHFIRNKLSPLTDYIEMMDDYSNADETQKCVIKPYLDSEFERVKISTNQILKRAQLMLEGSENPFVFSQTEKLGPQQLFSDIKLLWQNYGLDETKIKVSVFDKVKGERKYIYYNTNGFYIVLDNWISNIVRYNNGYYEFNLIEKDQSFDLIFINDFKHKGIELDGFKNFIRLYNENKKAEITKMKFHGLHAIWDCLDQMKIESKLDNQDDKVIFTITLIKYIERQDEEDFNN